MTAKLFNITIVFLKIISAPNKLLNKLEEFFDEFYEYAKGKIDWEDILGDCKPWTIP